MAHLPSRDRLLEWAMAVSQFLIAVAFLYGEGSGTVTMSPNVYGPLAYHIEAEVWAQVFLSTSLIYCIGLHQNGRAPILSPVLRMFSNTVLFSLHLVLGVSALLEMMTSAEFVGAVVVFYGMIMLCGLHGGAFYLNLMDYRRRAQRG